ncbi:MAG: hypothetical protein WCK98_08235 [bacterium]
MSKKVNLTFTRLPTGNPGSDSTGQNFSFTMPDGTIQLVVALDSGNPNTTSSEIPGFQLTHETILNETLEALFKVKYGSVVIRSKEFQEFHWLLTNRVLQAELDVSQRYPSNKIERQTGMNLALTRGELMYETPSQLVYSLNQKASEDLGYPNPLNGKQDKELQSALRELFELYSKHFPAFNKIDYKFNPETGKPVFFVKTNSLEAKHSPELIPKSL